MLRNTGSPNVWWYYAIAAVAIILPQAYFWSHITDDAFITYRYVDRWVAGYGLTFNPGERVEGFSSPLWVIVLGGAKSIGINVLDASRVFGLFATLITSFVLVRHLDLKTGSATSTGVALAIVLATPGLHYFASAGMETPLAMMLLIIAVHAWERDSIRISALAMGLAAITRPEITFHLLLWLLVVLTSKRKQKAQAALIGLLPLTGWLIFRSVYFDAWLPNTALAKAGGLNLRSISTLTPYLLTALGPLGVILIWRALRRDVVQLHDSTALCGLYIVATALFVLYAPLDWMAFGRFFMPALPLLALLVGYVFRADLFSIKMHPMVLALSFALLTLLAWSRPLKQYVLNEEMTMLMRSFDQRAVGEYLRDSLKAGGTIATGRLGAVSYTAADLIFWDFMGLTDKEVAQYKANGGLGASPIIARKPDHMLHVAVPQSWSYENDSALMQFMRRDYRFVRDFRQGNFGSFHLWTRKQ